jgi:4-alpha-glucanotransferase
VSQRPAGLIALARAYGIQPSYIDYRDQRRDASTESLIAALRALGAPVDAEADVRAALHDRRAAAAEPALDDVHVAWDGLLRGLRFRSPPGADRCRIRIRLEDGDERAVVAPLPPSPVRKEGAWPVRPIDVGGALPWGHHTLELDAGDAAFTTTVIAAPRRAYEERDDHLWGGFMPLYAFGDAERGAGTYAELREAGAWLAGRGGSFLGTLPLLAAFLDEPFEPSPYAPASRLFWNELFIDERELPVPTGDASAHVPGQLVDYRAIGSARTSILRRAARRFFDAGGDRNTDYMSFAARTPRLGDYATFRAACDRFRAGWPTWPDAARNGDLEGFDIDDNDVDYHRFVAWIADAQLGRFNTDTDARLYLDLPLGVHPDGYDVWRERDLFALGASAGAPPDALFVRGQDWGFPPMAPAALRASGHRYFVECIRHHLQHAGILRLDHVMALQRLYWIPRGLGPTQGVYVRYPMDELMAVLTLESQRYRATIVGEDLGTVSREIRRAMNGHAIHRMYVVQYEANPERDPPLNPVPRAAVASLNTHDMPPFAAFWRGLDIADQRDLGLLDKAQEQVAVVARAELRARLASALRTEPGADDDATRAALDALLRHLAASPARFMLINLEDLWLETRPQNVPGTSTERPNWRRRSRFDIEALIGEPSLTSPLVEVDRLRRSAPLRPHREKSHA